LDSTFFISSQFGPALRSTTRGTLRGYTPSITSRTTMATAGSSLSQGHAGTASRLFEPPAECHHRELDKVGRGPLDRGIDRGAQGLLAGVAIGTLELGEVADAVQKGVHAPPRLRGRDRRLDILLHLRQASEIGLDEGLRLLDGDALFPRQSLRSHPVDDTEVHDLGAPAHLVAHQLGQHAEHLGRGTAVDVLPRAKGLHQRRIATQVGQDTQFDLGSADPAPSGWECSGDWDRCCSGGPSPPPPG